MSPCAFKRFLDFILIDKSVLPVNPESHRYVVANGLSAATAVSLSFGNITFGEHQYSFKVLLSNYISRARFKRNSIRFSFSSLLSDILSKLKKCGFIIHSSEISIFHTSEYQMTSAASPNETQFLHRP